MTGHSPTLIHKVRDFPTHKEEGALFTSIVEMGVGPTTTTTYYHPLPPTTIHATNHWGHMGGEGPMGGNLRVIRNKIWRVLK